jgi:HEAT repeat protein
MDQNIRTQLDNIRSTDRELQNKAFTGLLQVTDKPVEWAYDAWDALLADLHHKDNHVRAIAAQVL